MQLTVQLPDSVRAFHAVCLGPDMPWTVSATYYVDGEGDLIERVEDSDLNTAIQLLESKLP